jgi:hypothetical protein
LVMAPSCYTIIQSVRAMRDGETPRLRTKRKKTPRFYDNIQNPLKRPPVLPSSPSMTQRFIELHFPLLELKERNPVRSSPVWLLPILYQAAGVRHVDLAQLQAEPV